MKSFLKDVFDVVFSFGGFMCAFMAGVIFLILTLGVSSANMTAQCVQAGMVKVQFDSGSYCVDPSNLTRVTAE